MFWRMVFSTLFKQKSKMLMIAMVVALGVSLSTAMINVLLGVGDKVNRELKIYGANITVMHKDASLLGDLYGIDDGAGVSDKFLLEEDTLKLKKIFWGFNIVDFAPILESKVEVEGVEGKVSMFGTWIDRHLVLSTGEELDTGLKRLRNWWHGELQGEWLSEDDTDKVMVGSLLAGRNGIKLGDSIRVKFGDAEKELTVKGIFIDGGKADESIVTNLETAQELTGLQEKISKIEVSALTTPENDLAKKAARDPKSLTISEYETWYCTAYVSAICHQIQEVVKDGVARPVRQVAESEGTILNKISLLMLLITVLSAICSALAISNLVTASVIERAQEIGLLKALGAYDFPIIRLLLTEIVLTGIVGGLLGYFSGLGFTQVIGYSVFGSSIEISMLTIPIICVLVIFVSVIGSIPAIRYLLNLKPTEVLHGK